MPEDTFTIYMDKCLTSSNTRHLLQCLLHLQSPFQPPHNRSQEQPFPPWLQRISYTMNKGSLGSGGPCRQALPRPQAMTVVLDTMQSALCTLARSPLGMTVDGYIQVSSTNVIDCLIVDPEDTLAVLQGGVDTEDGV